ncbi:MAG TPA: hypothetical protein VHH35_20955, partial [Pyrinomonadaceae bacterium]|nr:hypothetical protein [Pyrinomonadaceae bacterium]
MIILRKSLLLTCLLAASLLAFAQDKLTDSEAALVEGSKQAILATGISEPYFKAHFKLLSVVDRPSDRRVMWQFSVNEYQTVITDAIGYNTQGAAQIDLHSVGKALGQTSEIRRTITRARALKIMKSCIGPFDTPSVTYGPVDGRAELLLVASGRVPAAKTKSEREKEREREREEINKRKAATAGTDVIGGEEG